jgi:hypothetical protein
MKAILKWKVNPVKGLILSSFFLPKKLSRLEIRIPKDDSISPSSVLRV